MSGPATPERGIFDTARGWFDKGKPPPFVLLDVKLQNLFPIRVTLERDALLPAKIGLRKDIYFLDLIRLRAKADLTLPDGKFIYGFTCQDTIFKGLISLNVPLRAIEYRKRFPLPNGLYLSTNAGLQHVGLGPRQSIRDQFRPFVGAYLQLGGSSDGDDVVFGNTGGLSWKQRIPLPVRVTGIKAPRTSIEAYTNVQFPALTTFQPPVSDRSGAMGASFSGPPGIRTAPGQALTVHIDHYDLIFDL